MVIIDEHPQHHLHDVDDPPPPLRIRLLFQSTTNDSKSSGLRSAIQRDFAFRPSLSPSILKTLFPRFSFSNHNLDVGVNIKFSKAR